MCCEFLQSVCLFSRVVRFYGRFEHLHEFCSVFLYMQVWHFPSACDGVVTLNLLYIFACVLLQLQCILTSQGHHREHWYNEHWHKQLKKCCEFKLHPFCHKELFPLVTTITNVNFHLFHIKLASQLSPASLLTQKMPVSWVKKLKYSVIILYID